MVKCYGYWEVERDLIRRLGIKDIELYIVLFLCIIISVLRFYLSVRVLFFIDKLVILVGLEFI